MANIEEVDDDEPIDESKLRTGAEITADIAGDIAENEKRDSADTDADYENDEEKGTAETSMDDLVGLAKDDIQGMNAQNLLTETDEASDDDERDATNVQTGNKNSTETVTTTTSTSTTTETITFPPVITSTETIVTEGSNSTVVVTGNSTQTITEDSSIKVVPGAQYESVRWRKYKWGTNKKELEPMPAFKYGFKRVVEYKLIEINGKTRKVRYVTYKPLKSKAERKA